MSTMRRSVIAALALVLMATLAFLAYWRFGRAIEMPTAVAAEGTIAARVVGPGTVQARVPVTLGARVNAAVRQVHVDVGDTVHSGDLLVTLDDRDLSARRGVVAGQQEALARNTEGAAASLAKSRAELELALSKQRRDLELLAQGFVSQAVVDVSNATLHSAESAVDAARAALAARMADARGLSQEARYADTVLSHARITAPMNGVVVQRLVEVGSTVGPGTPLLKLVDPATLWVATRVDESVVARVRPGQGARIRLRSGEILTGKVARIARQSDAATRELDVHVAFDVPPRRFAIDQEAEVSIDVGQDRGIVVPVSSLARDRTGRQGVWVVDGANGDGRTRFTPVDTGAADDVNVLARKGLVGGERVVARADGVVANQRVRSATGATH